MECAVNPGAGHELERGDHRLTPATPRKKVLVVGGGPAGMEAARAAALRGHRVTLAEAAPDLGGTLRVAAKAPTRHAIGDILSWLESEIYRLGVEVRLGTYMDAVDVMQTSVDAVVVATGSTPRMDGIQGSHPGQPIRGMERRQVLSSIDLFMAPPANLGRTAVVIDDVGHYEGLAVSEQLIAAGLTVVYVTRLRGVAPLLQLALMNEPFLTRMQRRPFRYLIRTRAIAIESDAVVVGPVHLTDDRVDTERLVADTVVFVSHNRPNREIYTELLGRVADVRVVGDANSPRFLETAIREGHIAGASV
jgi:NADPH-dependent 2,4-dienoyl-CoA reductase/sulfur reductase-like enzyme